MTDDLLTAIAKCMHEFSKSQKLIGEFILNQYDKAAFMTAQKLGNAVNVSESTVVRFANEMGFAGYPEMQRSLQSLIKNRLTSLQRMEIASARMGETGILNAVLTQDIDKIRRTLEETSEEAFNAAVDKITGAGKIYILGAMSSSALARFLDYYLKLMFDNVVFVEAVSTSGIYQQIIRISSNDTFIALSFPRYSLTTVKAAQYAKKQGANIVAITDSVKSPLSEYADQLLLARSDMVSFADSLVAPLSLINALIVALGIKNKDKLSATFEKLEPLWEEHGVYQKDV